MLTFQVNDMTCGHCASAITRAVKAVDPVARVDIDLKAHRVHVESTAADPAEVAEAIQEAGYTPARAEPEAAAKPAKAAGCCGCCR